LLEESGNFLHFLYLYLKINNRNFSSNP